MKTLETAIYTRLSTDATLTTLAPGGVWHGIAPLSVSGTFVTFDQISGTDDYTLGMRATTTFSYLVKAVTPGESAIPAMDAAARVDALLSDYAMTLSAGRVLSIRREQTISLSETTQGETYQHAGAYYQSTTQE